MFHTDVMLDIPGGPVNIFRTAFSGSLESDAEFWRLQTNPRGITTLAKMSSDLSTRDRFISQTETRSNFCTSGNLQRNGEATTVQFP